MISYMLLNNYCGYSVESELGGLQGSRSESGWWWLGLGGVMVEMGSQGGTRNRLLKCN